MYTLEFKSSVEKDFRKIPKTQQVKIWKEIQKLKDDPRPKNSRKLAGTESDYRIRIGDYRVVYQIVDDSKLVVIFTAAHRKDIYR
ncbi:MAG: type II toxin-antitoxin system RelE/ParE family toxin [Bacteroidetes bacterium]|nr:type II toxin-antitoxin system RelE/ParE family toxin [Bacteroidota bacterium]